MLIKKLKQLSSDQFIRNISWLGSAELVQRIFRLATTVTLARVFTPYDYGMVSVIATTFQFANTLSLRAGIGAKLIQADEQELEIICNTAYWLNWILCLSLAIIQCIASYPIAWFYDNNQLILPICTLSLIYLMFPIFMVQSALIERENRLNVRAWCYAAQAIVSNIIIVGLALLDMGVWAVVWSMVLSYPVWIVITYSNHPWRPPKSVSLKQWKNITSFGSKLLGVELLNKLRLNIDYLLVGRFLGMEVLGLYFFAFNAGLGISQSVLNALGSAWYPHFCQVREDLKELKKRYFGSFKMIGAIVLPLVILQTSLAPFYVPIVFGEKWVTAIPVLILICFSALPIALSRSTSRLLQALDKAHIDLGWNVIFTVLFTTSLLLVMQGGIFWVAVSVLITQLVAMPIFALWIIRYVFGKRSASSD
ncbi:lipopolysaccharide biosynthesis protein [Moorena sp. SIO4G3]|uniref:lipopolysaccharide biosynthesis protein n=1 Tax=Moorena sp. SIO4G3 TaxID=2607821 RepID=UPI0014295AFB|nr:lipopolysaccharide biosynthesis protein [Moorena sp. SIO4G3]NEO76533.1 lipopolysaccharide biosynthesis protein [Moorena sp. SIO4G3]